MKTVLFVLAVLFAMSSFVYGEQPGRVGAVEMPLTSLSEQGRVPSTAVVESVEIRGNRRIPSATIKSKLQTKAGDAISLAAVNRDIQTLYSLGYFDDVRAEDAIGASGGAIVIFALKEKPLVRAVDYKGIRSITIPEIQQRFSDSKVALTIESPYSLAKAAEAAEVLKAMLVEKGHPEAVVGIATRNIPPNSVGVVFVIDEGASR